MPRWLGRLLYMLRGRRRVRLHLVHEASDSGDMTLQGLLLGRWCGHYVMQLPALVTSQGVEQLSSPVIEVPKERVIFVEVLG